MAAQFNLPFNIGLSDTPPPGLDPKVLPLADELYNAFMQVQLALHNVLGVGQQIKSIWPSLDFTNTLHQASQTRFYRKASEALAYGAMVNIFVNAGVINFRNANATNNTKPAHGVCTTLGGVAAGDYCEVICFQGLLTGAAGLVQGSKYFLSTVNGLVTAVAPVAAGNIEQSIGLALDTTALLFQFDFEWIQH